MKTNRRKFISTAVTGSMAAAAMPLSFYGAKTKSNGSVSDVKSRYAKLDEILKKPILKKELFATPVIIEIARIACVLKAAFYAGYVQKTGQKEFRSGIMIFQFFSRFFSENFNHILLVRMHVNWT